MRGNSLWGIFLVVLGIFFLFEVLGVISVSVWSLIWPLLIIFFGINLLKGALNQAPPSPPADSAEVETDRVILPIKGVEQAYLHLYPGPDSLTIHGQTAPDELLAGMFDGGLDYEARAEGETEETEVETSIVTQVVHLDMRPATEQWRRPSRRPLSWSFGLNPDLPLFLDIHANTRTAQLDLKELYLYHFHLRINQGSGTVMLPATPHSLPVVVENNGADLTLQLPDEAAADIQVEGRRESLALGRHRKWKKRKNGRRYQSPDYDTAVYKIEIELKLNAGQVTIR